ncbi:DnaJ domain protein [Paecilomyces variotii No. 5]|uniref:DnaJ domain protein n=1 Tax=Byssochlamys spectabilis (strain No. 5 / NBRC 109023) TaxID=1356009 RepID=V5FNP6_BYSSN|nr:DnaJ domain protein [Paecilomyces variotii No. 5]
MPRFPDHGEDRGAANGFSRSEDDRGSSRRGLNGRRDGNNDYDSFSDADYDRLMEYPDDVDYYSLLGLSRTPPPSDVDIRSAYRSLTLSFHPDKQPAHLREAAKQQFEKIREAYETLIDPKKRTVYDLLGAEGVRREWSAGGAMGKGGAAEQQQVGVKALGPEEFRRWFLDTMKARERKVLDSLVQSKGSISLGVDATSMISADEEEDYVYIQLPTLRPSSYAIGYSFRTPLPSFKELLGRVDEETENENEESENDNDPSKQAIQSEVTFSASVGGKLQNPMREAKFVYPDGTEEVKRVAMPLIMIAQNVSLGASINHGFRNVASTKGLFGKLPFSFLEGADASVTGLILPFPTVEAVVAKAISPFPGTKPLIFTFRTGFFRSIFQSLPVIGLQVTRELDAGRTIYCSWSSGSLNWPAFIQELLSPIVDLSVRLDDVLSRPTQMSKVEIGYISAPRKSTTAEEEEEDDEDDDDMPVTRKREVGAAESWQLQVDASPQGGGLSVVYGRNLFSHKGDEKLRSEWSTEGYHPISQDHAARPVRLEIQSTVGIDLSPGWHISGTRQVSDFTRMGLGVGVQGNKGLVMSVSWNRLGQKIRLPIAVCPLPLVSAEIAALAVILPWATYCGVEFGVIRPRERKRRRLALAKRQRQLEKQIAKRRAESQQAVDLMSEQVLRRQAREEENGGLVITKAEYGYYPPRDKKKNTGESKVIDVTIPVAALVDHGQLIIPREVVKFQIIGFYDPAPLRPKKLKIWYRFGGKEHLVEASDSEGITCPMRSHLI